MVCATVVRELDRQWERERVKNIPIIILGWLHTIPNAHVYFPT